MELQYHPLRSYLQCDRAYVAGDNLSLHMQETGSAADACSAIENQGFLRRFNKQAFEWGVDDQEEGAEVRQAIQAAQSDAAVRAQLACAGTVAHSERRSMSYRPTHRPLPGEQWIPSNGTEGSAILCSLCSTCARDKAMREGADFDECDDNELCEIIAASFRVEAVEWRELDNGDVTCVAYVRHGESICDQRCEHTMEMFA